jgi:hypothetical protein
MVMATSAAPEYCATAYPVWGQVTGKKDGRYIKKVSNLYRQIEEMLFALRKPHPPSKSGIKKGNQKPLIALQ